MLVTAAYELARAILPGEHLLSCTRCGSLVSDSAVTAHDRFHAAPPPPGEVWLVRDPATCPHCPCGGDVTAIFPAEPQAAGFTARLPRRGLVIEKWPVPGHE